MPQVEELHSVAGEYDFLAKIRTTDARALEDVIYQIKAIEGVARTTSTVVLNTEFEDRPLDLGWMGPTRRGADNAPQRTRAKRRPSRRGRRLDAIVLRFVESNCVATHWRVPSP